MQVLGRVSRRVAAGSSSPLLRGGQRRWAGGPGNLSHFENPEVKAAKDAELWDKTKGLFDGRPLTEEEKERAEAKTRSLRKKAVNMEENAKDRARRRYKAIRVREAVLGLPQPGWRTQTSAATDVEPQYTWKTPHILDRLDGI